MSDYQLRAVGSDGEPSGPWFNLEGRDEFHTVGGRVQVRRTPPPTKYHRTTITCHDCGTRLWDSIEPAHARTNPPVPAPIHTCRE